MRPSYTQGHYNNSISQGNVNGGGSSNGMGGKGSLEGFEAEEFVPAEFVDSDADEDHLGIFVTSLDDPVLYQKIL
jgi:hypothetical protein